MQKSFTSTAVKIDKAARVKGGVGPSRVNHTIRVVLDQGLRDLDSIFCGSGRNTHTIEMGMTDLITLTDTTVYPIVKDDPSAL